MSWYWNLRGHCWCSNSCITGNPPVTSLTKLLCQANYEHVAFRMSNDRTCCIPIIYTDTISKCDNGDKLCIFINYLFEFLDSESRMLSLNKCYRIHISAAVNLKHRYDIKKEKRKALHQLVSYYIMRGLLLCPHNSRRKHISFTSNHQRCIY